MKQLITLFAFFLLLNCTYDSNQENTKPWAFEAFVKVDSINPILKPDAGYTFTDPISGDAVAWQARNVLNPAAVAKGDSIYLFYRAQDSSGTSRIGIATSADGLHFTKREAPEFFPAEDVMKTKEWNYRKFTTDSLPVDCVSCLFDGVEDPRLVESEDGFYIMTYTAYDGKTARLALASSNAYDLSYWTKHGLVLKDTIYADLWSKSGAIVVEMKEGRPIAKKIDDKYWMYFGDTKLFMAHSTDLINWEPLLNAENGKMIEVLQPRPGYFDSRLVEPGPFALYKEEGILLIYNASNAANYNDWQLPKFTYAAGQALFDKDKPFKLLDRTDDYFIYPDKEYEKVGEVNEVCFVEGLVNFKGKWFLYYGTADSKIAVAVSEGD